jgi:hypothetical protein
MQPKQDGMRTWTLTALLALATGCTAAKANISIINAEQALVRAQGEDAPDVAKYEYTMAARYLEKAREEAGYSEYRVADALARQSAEWSDRAIIFVERRGRTSINLDDFSDVPDQQMIPPTPAPEPDVDEVPPPEAGKPSDADLFEPETPVEPLAPEPAEPTEDPEPVEEEPEDEFEMDDDIDLEGGQ